MIADNPPPPWTSLRLQFDSGVAMLQLDRSERLNALTPPLMNELIDAAHWLAAQPTLRIVLLGGIGRAFCAGFDLDAMRASRGNTDREATDLGRRMIAAWLAIPVPTIAAVQGHCVGGGVLLAAACDLRLAADDARFWIPEMALGIPLGWGGVPLLTRLLGSTLAMELVLDCQRFDAAQALAWRFVNRVLPRAELETAAQEWARRLAERPRRSLRTTKRRFAASADMLCTLDGSQADADDLVAAYQDPETLQVQARWIAARRG